MATYDLYWDDVVLALHMDGAYNGTVFTDSSTSAHSVTRVGALTKTTEKKFGTASAYFDGSFYLTCGSSSDFQLTNDGDFTVDCWFNIGGTSSTSQHLFQIFGASVDYQWSVYLYEGNRPCLYSANGASTGAIRITAASAVSTLQWHHLAVVRSGSTITLYVNGVSVGSTSTSVFPTDTSLALSIARQNFSPTSQQYLYGYIDDFRITKGAARYTADFTPPTEAFATQGMGVYSTEILPKITASGTGHGSWSANSGVVLSSVSGSGSGISGPVGRSSLSILSLTGEGGGGTLFLPKIVAESSGIIGSIGGSIDNATCLIAAGNGNPGVICRSSISVPAIEGVGYGVPISNQTLPAIVANGSGRVGQIARSTQSLLSIQGEASGKTQLVGESQSSLPIIRVSGAGRTAVVGASDVALKKLIVAASGFSGSVGSSEVTLPVVRSESSGHVAVIGVSVITLPAIIAEGSAARPVGTTYQGYALQTQTKALTTYSGLRINSFAHFNGVALAAGPDGLFVLEGSTDAGALIEARVRVGITDFDTPELKRIEAMYVNYRTDGDLSLKVIADDTTEYDYPIAAHGKESLNTTRTVIGKGLKGVYWQFEVANENGADFELDALDPRILKQTRRIG